MPDCTCTSCGKHTHFKGKVCGDCISKQTKVAKQEWKVIWNGMTENERDAYWAIKRLNYA